MMTDPIADMLTRIRNAGSSGHKWADIPVSKLKTEILFSFFPSELQFFLDLVVPPYFKNKLNQKNFLFYFSK